MRTTSLLAGKNGQETYEIGNGNLITKLPGGYDQVTPARPGSSLELTIDRDLQYEVQQVLFARMTAANADFGAAVVMDVHTGEVLAQASYPSYDADAYANYPQSAYKDAATQVTVDPGSSAKIVAIGAALNTGAIAPDATVTLPASPIHINGGAVQGRSCRSRRAPRSRFRASSAYSSNLGTINIASHLSAATIYQYQHLFGLGTATGEGVQNEAPGDLLPPSQWTATSWGSIPIGEGLSATPLQMTAAYCAIANNGTWVQPHIVKATIGPDGKATPASGREEPRGADADGRDRAADRPRGGDDGAGRDRHRRRGQGVRDRRQDRHRSPVPQRRATCRGTRSRSSGWRRPTIPQYVIGVFAHVPDGSGGLDAAPAFRDMMTFTLQHYQVPATGDKAPTFQLTVK